VLESQRHKSRCSKKVDRWVDMEDTSEESCNDSDPDEVKPKFSPETEQEVQRRKQLIRAEAGGDLDKLRALVPQDKEGNPTSVGSIGHAIGSCKGCIFVNTKSGCGNGVSCGFCHFPHQRRRNKVRHCKGKRQRHEKILARVMAQIDDDPDSFSLDTLQLPPSIACEESTRAKFMARVESYLKQAKSERFYRCAHARGIVAASSAARLDKPPVNTMDQTNAGKAKRVSL